MSFPEALQFRGVEPEPYSRSQEAVVVNALEDYLRWGGFPEILLAEESLRRKIITEYADLLYYRDLLDQFSIRNEQAMRLLLKHCLSQPATLMSAHKLYHDFRSLGLRVSKNTIYDYVRFLQEAGLVYTVPVFSRSLRKQEQNPKKLFLVDVGLMQAFTVRPDADRGRKLENLVFLRKQSEPGELFYAMDRLEIDLVQLRENGPVFTNVSWSMAAPETARREMAGLTAALEQYPKATLELIAHELGASPIPPAIECKLDWKYLLESGV